jgi:predicted DNA-binding transcriptional regulator AlpA
MSYPSPKGAVCSRFDHVVAFDSLPNGALIDLRTIIALACRSRASIWRDVQAGRLPKPVAIGPQARRWRVEDVRAYLKGSAA